MFLRILVGGALYLVLLTHYFPPSELAAYYLFVSLFNILALVVSAPLTSRFDESLDDKEKRVHVLLAIALLSLLEGLFIAWYMRRDPIIITLFTVIINIVNNLNVLKFYNIDKDRVWASSIPYVAKVGFTWIVTMFFERTFENILWASLIPYIFVIWWFRKELIAPFNWNLLIEIFKTLPKTISLDHRGGSLFWIRSISIVRNYLDNVIFNRPGVSDVEKTRYNTAAYVYKLFSESSGSMISVNFLRYEKEGVLTIRKIAFGLGVSFLLMVAFAFGVILFDYYFPWVLKYDIIKYLIVLGIGYVLWAPSVIMRDTLFALNKNKDIIISEIVSLVVFLVLAWGKEPLEVAYALTVSLIIAFLVYGWFFWNAIKDRIKGRDLKTLLLR